jgi:hypothetical protein
LNYNNTYISPCNLTYYKKMEDQTKKEKAPKKQLIVASRALLAKVGGDMTLKERCEYDHVGRCGACDNEGRFTACA